MIKHRFGWHVIRVNPKSVTVALDWHDPPRGHKVTYADVHGHHTAARATAYCMSSRSTHVMTTRY